MFILVVDCLCDIGLFVLCLYLELIEMVVIGDEMLVVVLLDKFYCIGVKVWLDDFGIGFFGFSYLC